MHTEVREQCVVEKGLQNGYCGNDKFVADHEEGIHRSLVVTSSC
jgi:hypothetical protein